MTGTGLSDPEHTTETEEQRTIPVWKTTRDRAREIKGDQTYQEFISTLLDEHASDIDRSRS